MTRFRFTPQASDDLLEIWRYIAADNPEAADRQAVEELPENMDDAKLGAAVESVLAKHPQEVVIVYLHDFYEMNEARWSNLEALLQNDPRLKLKRDA